MVYLLVYVYDIIITGNDPHFLSSLIAQLSTTFELKDLGPLSYFLAFKSPSPLRACSYLRLSMLRIYYSRSIWCHPN